MKNKMSFANLLLLTFLLVSFVSNAEEEPRFSWPIEFETEGGHVVTLYQPQLESYKQNILEGRMAVTIKPTNKDMIFGALWFKSRMSTDTENRTVLVEEMEIVKTHFPEMVDKKNVDKFSELLLKEIESTNLEMSLDRLIASLNEVENLNQLSDQINNDPPTIYFRTAPAMLLMIDGDPILKEDKDSGLEYVINTPYFLVKDPKKDNYYITDGTFWHTSKEILKGWESVKKPPSKVRKFAKDNISEEDSETDSITEALTEAPEVIVVTKASELVTVSGEIEYKPIDNTTLLYVENSESDIIMDITSQEHYILLAGRWYHSKSLKDGDWKFCEPSDLPDDFKNIPESSPMVSVRASIPGTPEAQTTLLEQSIPQTATIDRSEAKVEVKYDGNPKFEKIENTDVSYALNTEKTVLLIKNVYYVVDDAVWFMSDKPTGPWEICTVRPDEVDQIPPESPVYNVKYTYIYDSTPEVVYVGYLPGYTSSYIYHGVVVYGTGYYYRPWYGYYYYPRHATWGYGVHYSPYYGWGCSFGIRIGWGFHPYRRGLWGPRGYHRGYRHGYNRGYRRGYNSGYRNGARAGYRAGQRNSNRNSSPNSNRNVYNNRNTGVKQTGNVGNSRASNNINNKGRASGKSNNMYSDKSGNVYQRNQNGNFDNKSNSRQNQQPSTTQQRQSQQRQSQNSQQQLNRSYQNRSTGTQNYNRSQQQRSSGSRPSGGSRGGGGRGGGGRR